MGDLVWINFGLAGGMLVALFVALRSGALYTSRSVDRIVQSYEDRIKREQDYNHLVMELNEKLDERNDLLTSRIDQMLAVSRANGMIEALPPATAERVVK